MTKNKELSQVMHNLEEIRSDLESGEHSVGEIIERLERQEAMLKYMVATGIDVRTWEPLEIHKVRIGSLVRDLITNRTMVVTGHYGSYLIAVDTVMITEGLKSRWGMQSWE